MPKTKEEAIKRLTRAIRRRYFDVIDDYTLKLKEGPTYHWEKKDVYNFTLLEAVNKLINGISKYFIERTPSQAWKEAEKLFHGYNFPYRPGSGWLAAAFPPGLIKIIGGVVIPDKDLMGFLRKFYLSNSFSLMERRFYLELLKKVEESRVN